LLKKSSGEERIFKFANTVFFDFRRAKGSCNGLLYPANNAKMQKISGRRGKKIVETQQGKDGLGSELIKSLPLINRKLNAVSLISFQNYFVINSRTEISLMNRSITA